MAMLRYGDTRVLGTGRWRESQTVVLCKKIIKVGNKQNHKIPLWGNLKFKSLNLHNCDDLYIYTMCEYEL